MASYRFNLRNSKATTATPIYLIVEHQKTRVLKYATGIKVHPDQWNINNKENPIRRSADHYKKNNLFLERVKKYATNIITQMMIDKEPLRSDVIKALLEHELGIKKIVEKENTLLSFAKSYYENLKTVINPETGTNLSRQTISKYHCLYSVLREFEAEQRKKFTFEDINIDFYNKFLTFLKNKNFQPNTIGSKYIQPLKALCNEAIEQGIKVNLSYKKRGFVTPSEKVSNTYLNVSEIESIEELNLTANKRLECVRDMFLIGYYTGQRYGDYSKFRKEQIAQNNIYLRQNKVTEKIIIPLTNKAQSIFEKYDYQIKGISQQKFNDYIKEVCKMAGITANVSKTTNKGGKIEVKLYEKWELITSHTARRSFATNAYLSNKANVLNIMRITGHSTQKQFMKYICITDEENANIMRDILEMKPIQKINHLKAV